MSASTRPVRKRTVEDVWGELLNSLDAAVYEFGVLGEHEQSTALRTDTDYLVARMRRHVRNVSKVPR